jgi:hypothetical protein
MNELIKTSENLFIPENLGWLETKAFYLSQAKGKHNASNMLMAQMLIEQFGVDQTQALEAVKYYFAPTHGLDDAARNLNSYYQIIGNYQHLEGSIDELVMLELNVRNLYSGYEWSNFDKFLNLHMDSYWDSTANQRIALLSRKLELIYGIDSSVLKQEIIDRDDAFTDVTRLPDQDLSSYNSILFGPSTAFYSTLLSQITLNR